MDFRCDFFVAIIIRFIVRTAIGLSIQCLTGPDLGNYRTHFVDHHGQTFECPIFQRIFRRILIKTFYCINIIFFRSINSCQIYDRFMKFSIMLPCHCISFCDLLTILFDHDTGIVIKIRIKILLQDGKLHLMCGCFLSIVYISICTHMGISIIGSIYKLRSLIIKVQNPIGFYGFISTEINHCYCQNITAVQRLSLLIILKDNLIFYLCSGCFYSIHRKRHGSFRIFCCQNSISCCSVFILSAQAVSQ